MDPEYINFNQRLLSLELVVSLHQHHPSYGSDVLRTAEIFLNWLNENEV